MKEKAKVQSLSDAALLRALSQLNRQSRRVEADLVAHIAEVDVRRLYAQAAKSSMHVYCVEVLEFTDFEAYLRITAARATRDYPELLNMLRDGRLHLTAVARLASHLTPENWRTVLGRAAHRSKREIEELIAELNPRPDVPAKMRKLPTLGNTAVSQTFPLVPERVPEGAPTATSGPSLRPRSRRSSVEPLALTSYKVQFTAGPELHDKLERLQALMRTTIPDGDLAKIIDLAVTEKLDRLEAKRLGKTKKPRKTLAQTKTAPSSRQIPAAVRRAVHARDKGQCTYVDPRGRRCTARERLEFHHHGTPFGRGGDHSVQNIRLMCRTHNALLAEQEYGEEKMARYRRRRVSDDRISETALVYRAGVSSG
jgi:hypothetical protein